jgi:MFS family permease
MKSFSKNQALSQQNKEPALASSLEGDIEEKVNFLLKLRKYLTKGGQALKHRNYRLFWTGQLISLIGTWMQNLAQAWLVLTLSNNDPLALGLVSALQFLPTMLLSLFTGVIADRYSKHRLLIITQTSSMLLAALLGVLVVGGWVQLWHVYLCALALGAVNALDMPTRQSFVSEMVSKEDLMNAVALNSTIFNAGRVVGPALAGLLIGLGEKIFNSTEAGVALAVWLNAISYLAVIFNLLRMDTSKLFPIQRKASTGTVMSNLKEGLVYIWKTPAILSLIILVGTMGTFGFNFNIWIPVLSRLYLNVGADGYGVLMAGLGLGALVSSLAMAVSGRTPKHSRILLALAFFAAFEIGVAISGWFILSFLLMFGMGLAMIRVSAASNTFIQMNTPDYLRGRVMSFYLLVFAGTTPIGSLFIGWLGSVGGTPFSMFVGGALSAIAIPFVWIYYIRRRPNAIPAAKAQPAPVLTEAASPSPQE